MDDMTKEWVSAKLEAAEERANARLADMQARLDIGLANLETQTKMIGENVRHLADIVARIHDDGRETRTDINRLSEKIDDSEKDARKDFHEIKSHQANMRLWYIGTTIALFLAALAVLTFGKDMFEWGRFIE